MSTDVVVSEKRAQEETLFKSLYNSDGKLEFASLIPWSDVVEASFEKKRLGFTLVAVCPICSAFADEPRKHWDDHIRVITAIRYLGGIEQG